MSEHAYNFGMPTTATDLRHGRRGGRWLPTGYQPATPRPCPVCAGPMLAGQSVHRDCEPAELTLFDPDDV
jgi:hypothetical protein